MVVHPSRGIRGGELGVSLGSLWSIVGEKGLPSSLEGVLKVPEGSPSESSIVWSLEVSCASSLIGASIDNAIDELLRFGAFYGSFLDSLISVGKGGFKNILQDGFGESFKE